MNAQGFKASSTNVQLIACWALTFLHAEVLMNLNPAGI
jgi:hypothetical protein